ncbi:SDR family oxidoreductase [Robbsia sp. Bb-Pol-6]|uniref:SDR family oxidoreductase n=2 Tax=Robbsia betulipollinis TaxID=2981849 RepID=A0ABT3ZR88_9BURK|nr:SDR family oxidoreductase [Robbsia betulipollinis]MCY0389068.1 SDR family oxidoreductase [Robbsia betulipollinis]
MKVFLTGASSGLGWALAAEFARRGATLGLVARRAELLERFARAHPAQTVVPYVLDVTDSVALAAAAADFTARHGRPDIVVANAGISAGSISGLGDLDVFRRVMDVNYLGMVATFEPFVGAMREARAGTLVGIASVAGVRGLPGAGAYSASKAAAIRYLESLRVELRSTGVAVVTLAPGYIRTPMTDHNPYRMPFLMEADAFATRAVDAMLARRRFTVLPWPMRGVSMLLHVLPRWLYDRAFARAPRKPRAADG